MPSIPPLSSAPSRVDGRLKVTGQARYAAEHRVAGCTYGVLATSTIARGRIKRFNTKAAERAPGVLAVLTYLNAPKVPAYASATANHNDRVEGQEIKVFYDDQIHFSNQPVALVVAETLEQAQHAAALVRVEYAATTPETDLGAHLADGQTAKGEPDYLRGQAGAYAGAPVHTFQEYRTPIQVHNPMETHATVALWQGERLTVYNKTQAPKLAQQDLMRMFQLPESQVQVHSPFVGGAFGGASRIWPPEVAAILGAKKVGRPVQVMLGREQEFNMVGYRPRSVQQVGLGAQRDGTLVGITHLGHGSSSRYELFSERMLHPTKTGYACPNLDARYRVVPLDLSTPAWTRGPGEASGSFAIESAMDELAYALNMDPLALRLKNFAPADPEKNIPWSSNRLRECYAQGAERFGWKQRPASPRSMRQGPYWVGWGMAMGIYKAERAPATARAQLRADGTLLVQSGTADVGPGTATAMTQVAAAALGIAPGQVKFELGDSSLPPAAGQFGSHTMASVGTAVHAACTALQQQLRALAVQTGRSQFGPAKAEDLVADNGALYQARDPGRRVSFAEILRLHDLPALEVTQEAKPGPEAKENSGKSFGAHFVEVLVHARTGEVRVTRVVSAIDAGRVISAKTARSQVLGAVTWGISMALMEQAVLDHRYGRFVNHNLAEYHIATHADVPDIDVILLDEPDPVLNPIGAKGLGEIGLIGFTAAVANAVFHATGQRIRELPITPDKLLGGGVS
ncbi:xanthine dehydrogenase family protein molybdopterin-binding subunit [Hymenobacter coccineus]|uniref:Aldehyde oxidase n=1 Tax=Hymenobacter coccineus TaxID=1908235 RepID=A0A1G1TIC9_9BACT|nr:xanthine dehydrogenase family protein molybdopterin-binding subunit [Hymenobacter coccineus]OGX90624.1 aldehyde oxidase [Hymenobacter coccineus]